MVLLHDLTNQKLIKNKLLNYWKGTSMDAFLSVLKWMGGLLGGLLLLTVIKAVTGA